MRLSFESRDERNVSFRFLKISAPRIIARFTYPRRSNISAYPLAILATTIPSPRIRRLATCADDSVERCVASETAETTDSVGPSTCRGSSLADTLGVTIAREREEEKGEKEIGRERDRPTAAEVQRRRSGWAVHTGYYWLVSRLAAD